MAVAPSRPSGVWAGLFRLLDGPRTPLVVPSTRPDRSGRRPENRHHGLVRGRPGTFDAGVADARAMETGGGDVGGNFEGDFGFRHPRPGREQGVNGVPRALARAARE